ncbi:meiotically up-regulated gene 113-domain-containing protein [Triangularia verruculosa]|uniref:Meiotically up-regulated gene 113-domain-containing protein n=1 Tax=Triangularia verruculosa TaxID=2587418 RepID=A0AAN6XNU5_9PEZI|nr:meiotically up-regulated gene 113-domain-containing protein [Triangularia verruculosa]
MPIFANTPESRLGRSDSKDPGATCRGITGSGRPCRRSIINEDAPPPPKPKRNRLHVDDPSDPDLYCWQHKDQAAMSAHSSPGPKLSHTPILEGRTSIDTLAERLGLMKTHSEPRPSRYSGGYSYQGPRPEKKKGITCCFCFHIPLDDFVPPPRPQPTPVQKPTSVSTPYRPSGNKPSHSRPSSARPSSARPSSSQKKNHADLIPANAPPETAAKLAKELAKPFSDNDDAGYIYIFWLTPESQPLTPAAETARSLLSPPSSRPSGSRTISDMLASFAAFIDDDDDDARPRSSNGNGGRSKANKKILLKIGRATNVQRRLNEWQRQCGYNISLIRYYPYVPSNSTATTERKVPHSHKVERLVHIELDGLGLRVADRAKCEACGKEHREWFEVEASRKAVEVVDDIVRKWSDWDETQA